MRKLGITNSIWGFKIYVYEGRKVEIITYVGGWGSRICGDFFELRHYIYVPSNTGINTTCVISN